MNGNVVKTIVAKKTLSQSEFMKLFIQLGAQQEQEKICLQKFLNLCMKHGKKNNSYKLLLGSLKQLSYSQDFSNTVFQQNPHQNFSRTPQTKLFPFLVNAIDNVKPIIEVRKVRISGTTQLVPSIIPKNRQLGLAIRWIIEAAIARRRIKKKLTLDQCFLAEILDAYQGIGTVKKKRDDLHKLAEVNRGFAHYRWW